MGRAPPTSPKNTGPSPTRSVFRAKSALPFPSDDRALPTLQRAEVPVVHSELQEINGTAAEIPDRSLTVIKHSSPFVLLN